MAMRAIQCCRLLLRTFIKELTLLHLSPRLCVLLSLGIIPHNWDAAKFLAVELNFQQMPKRRRKRKKKEKTFRAVPAVKALARERIGTVRPSQLVPHRKSGQQREKHKPTLGEWLEESD